jgi:hypothetical protein
LTTVFSRVKRALEADIVTVVVVGIWYDGIKGHTITLVGVDGMVWWYKEGA